MKINDITLNEGVIFERAYDILMEKQQIALKNLIKNDSNALLDTSLLVPIAINGAFACEIYIKSFLPEGTKGHKINELYEQLNDSLRCKIKNITVDWINKSFPNNKYDEARFEADIIDMGNSFVEWRYFYEGNIKRTDPWFLKGLMIALRETALSEKEKVLQSKKTKKE